MLIYTEQTTGFDKKNSYRNPRFWSGEVEPFNEIQVIGDFPEIEKAYKANDVKVSVKKPQAKKSQTKKDSVSSSQPTSTAEDKD